VVVVVVVLVVVVEVVEVVVVAPAHGFGLQVPGPMSMPLLFWHALLVFSWHTPPLFVARQH